MINQLSIDPNNTKVDRVDHALAFLFIFFVCFPYLQIIPTASYNQPYALIFGFLYMIYNFRLTSYFKNHHFYLILMSFGFLGLLFFLFTAYPYENDQDLKYLTTYLTLPIIAISSFYAYLKYPKLISKILIYTVLIWFVVALVQTLVSVTFMSFLIGTHSDTAEIGNTSGRGVLSLAPEPTHYGFHILLIGVLTCLITRFKKLALLCLFQALFLAKSSSALLALLMGGLLFLLFQRSWWTRLIFFLVVGFLIMLFTGSIPLFEQNENSSRMIVLINNFIRNPTQFISSDASVNARIGGAYLSLTHIVENFFVPNGLDQNEWLATRQDLLNDNNRDLMLLSNAGPPSGIGVVLFQLGFIGLPYIYYMFKQIFIVPLDSKYGWLKYAVFFIALSQFSLATPAFGLLLGTVIAINKKAKSHVKH